MGLGSAGTTRISTISNRMNEATHYRPGRPSSLSGPACLLVLEYNVDLRVDSFVFYVLEFQEGLLRDIESVLEGV